MIFKIVSLPFSLVSKIVRLVAGIVGLVLSLVFGTVKVIIGRVFGVFFGALIGFFLGKKHLSVKLFTKKKK